ncbi:MAG: hypothetical protein GF315_14985 [candidate division Zixibacteria bacterium]|nr:hypothetical protein [candidate division Zixibacteria bacterium]
MKVMPSELINRIMDISPAQKPGSQTGSAEGAKRVDTVKETPDKSIPKFEDILTTEEESMISRLFQLADMEKYESSESGKRIRPGDYSGKQEGDRKLPDKGRIIDVTA